MATGSINRLRSKSLSPATKGDIVDASRAIYDELSGKQHQRLKELETEVTLRLGKSLDARVSDSLDGVLQQQTKALQNRYDAKVLELSESYERKAVDLGEFYQAKIKRIEEEFATTVDQVRKSFESRLTTVERSHAKSLELMHKRKSYDDRVLHLQDALEKRLGDQVSIVAGLGQSYDDKVEFLVRSHEEGMDRIGELLKNLQIPPPRIDVNLPEQVVNLTTGEVVVNIPKQQPPTVNVETAVPMKKTIEYDSYGRPVVITEVKA